MRLISMSLVAALLSPIAAHAADNPWNGSWKLDPARSSPGGGGAPGYRFLLGPDNSIRWEIPELGEVVTGHVDGRPMQIHRTKPTPGLTLSVSPGASGGPPILNYAVARNGIQLGGGTMTLIEGGKAWVDVSWGGTHPEDGGELVYIRQ